MRIIAPNYTFTKGISNAGTILFTGVIIPSTLEKILLITNTTTGTIIYNPYDPLAKGSYTGSTLTLFYDTSAFSNTDKLQISVEDEEYSYFRSLSTSTTAQSIKATGGRIFGFNIINLANTDIYVKFYNVVAGSVNPASDIPRTYFVPVNGSITIEPKKSNELFSNPTALSVRTVTMAGDTNITSPSSSPIIELTYI